MFPSPAAPYDSSDAVVGSPAQESEALLVPVKTDKPKRYRSGSYGSRQDHDTATYVLALRQGKVPTDGAEYEVGGEAQADQATETGGGTTQDKNGKGVRKDGTTLVSQRRPAPSCCVLFCGPLICRPYVFLSRTNLSHSSSTEASTKREYFICIGP